MAESDKSDLKTPISALLIGSLGLFLAFFLQIISNAIGAYSNLSVLASAYSVIRPPPLSEYQIVAFSSITIFLTIAVIIMAVSFRGLIPSSPSKWSLLLVGIASANFLFLPIPPMITGLLSPASILNVGIVNSTVPTPERIATVENLNALWNFVVFLRYFLIGVIALVVVLSLLYVVSRFPLNWGFEKQVMIVAVVSLVVVVATYLTDLAATAFSPSYHNFFGTISINVTICPSGSTCPSPLPAPSPANPLDIYNGFSYIQSALAIFPEVVWGGFVVLRVIVPWARKPE